MFREIVWAAKQQSEQSQNFTVSEEASQGYLAVSSYQPWEVALTLILQMKKTKAPGIKS